MIDYVKIAEDAIKSLKDYVELKKAQKKLCIQDNKNAIQELADALIEGVGYNIEQLKGE